MDFNLTDEQQMIVSTVRNFVESELYPHEAEVERTGHLRTDLIREVQSKAIEAGLKVQPYIKTCLSPGSGVVT